MDYLIDKLVILSRRFNLNSYSWNSPRSVGKWLIPPETEHMMLKKWRDIKHKTTPEQRASAIAKAEAILEKMSLHELRKARRLSTVSSEAHTDCGQDGILKVEMRRSLALGTLETYVRGLGGALEVRAVFSGKTVEIVVARDGQQTAERAA